MLRCKVLMMRNLSAVKCRVGKFYEYDRKDNFRDARSIESEYADCKGCIDLTVVPVLSAVTVEGVGNAICKAHLRQAKGSFTAQDHRTY